MPPLRNRIDRLTTAAAEAAEQERPPLLFILFDGEAYAGGEPTTIEAWEERYGETARRLLAEGRIEFTGVDFRPPTDPTP